MTLRIIGWLALGPVLAQISCKAPNSGDAPIVQNSTAPQPSASRESPRHSRLPADREMPGLHNLVEFHDGFISGSAPQGEAAFESLAHLGIRTIISVDGAAPQMELAGAHGMRYVHLPIGYNGFEETRRRQLVRATRDALRVGPVYIHCHHGKHRSPAAAAVIAASLGWMTPEQGVDRMRDSGTAANYKGLYDCARRAVVLTASEIDETPGDFAPVWTPSSFVKGMLELDAAFENLKAIELAGWKTPDGHPDLVPVAEAGRLADLYRLMKQSAYAADRGDPFVRLLESAENSSTELERLLAQDAINAIEIGARFRAVAATCKDCHTRFRD